LFALVSPIKKELYLGANLSKGFFLIACCIPLAEEHCKKHKIVLDCSPGIYDLIMLSLI
jgi:hypothetical protein